MSASEVNLTARALRGRVAMMANSCDGDEGIIGRGLKHYTDGCGDDDVVSVLRSSLDGFTAAIEDVRAVLPPPPPDKAKRWQLAQYSVPGRPLTDAEVDEEASRLVRDWYDVYTDCPGVWPTLAQFIAFRIGVESLRYIYHGKGQDTLAQMNRFALACLKHAKRYES